MPISGVVIRVVIRFLREKRRFPGVVFRVRVRFPREKQPFQTNPRIYGTEIQVLIPFLEIKDRIKEHYPMKIPDLEKPDPTGF